MTAWPNARKPLSRDPQIFGQYDEKDLPTMQAAAAEDREAGHMALPVLVELKDDVGHLRYEVVDGPRCNHTCQACRADIADLSTEFGTGAIGVFNESSGGEMEKLRIALRELAVTIQQQVGGVTKRVEQLEDKAKAELPEKSE
jgi:hypothetical protein